MNENETKMRREEIAGRVFGAWKVLERVPAAVGKCRARCTRCDREYTRQIQSVKRNQRGCLDCSRSDTVDNPPCPVCNGPTNKSGETAAKSQRYRCNACDKRFTPEPKKRVYESTGEGGQSRRKRRSPAQSPKTAGEVMLRFAKQVEGDS